MPFTANVVHHQGLLPVGVAVIGAVRVGVDELPDREPVGLLGRGDLCPRRHGTPVAGWTMVRRWPYQAYSAPRGWGQLAHVPLPSQ